VRLSRFSRPRVHFFGPYDLAHRVGGWSTPKIGRFYNGRDHSSVCHAIKRILAPRDSNADVEELLSPLIQELTTNKGLEVDPPLATPKAYLSRARDTIWTNKMLDDLAARIAVRSQNLLSRKINILCGACLDVKAER
jgi:hypothetical protein